VIRRRAAPSDEEMFFDMKALFLSPAHQMGSEGRTNARPGFVPPRKLSEQVSACPA
jgi:hypothetical protein